MISWVSNKLEGYYTISEVDALLSTLEQEFNTKLDTQKAYLESLINALSEELKGMIANNSTLITALRSDVTTLQGTSAKLATKIAENATAIATNAQNIIANAESISANSGNIGANTSKIAENKSAIEANAALIAENKSVIAALKSSTDTAIAKNATAIATNAENIAKNAELIAKNATAINNNAEAIAQNTADIAQLQQDLATTKTEIAEAYKSAISTAITTLDGALRGEIATKVSTLNTRIDNEVTTINAAIDALSARVTTLEGEVDAIQQQIADVLQEIADMQQNISDLMKRIQSVTYIPKYSDGKATMTKNIGVDEGIAEFDFQISPKDAVADIAANWQSILSMKAVYTQTRAVSFIDLPILSCEADEANGVITITASGENLSEEFFNGNQETSVALYISDGNNSITSNFINLVISSKTGAEVIPSDEIWYTSVNGDIIDLYYPTAYDAPIISHTYQDGKGIIKFGSTLTEIQDWAFKDTQVVTLTMPNTVTKIGVKAFDNCSSLIEIGMSEAIKSIGTEAFSRSSIKSIIIPDGVTSLPSMVFSSCEYLTDVKLSENLTNIGDRVFSSCSRLKSIELPESLKSISYWAFSGTALTEITIPSNVVSISWSAFDNTIKTVYCLPTTPPNASKDSGSAHWYGLGNNSNLVIYVPASSLSAYKSATNWSEYATKFVGYSFE